MASIWQGNTDEPTQLLRSCPSGHGRFRRAGDAHDALLEYEPPSLQSFAVKALVLLRSPFDPDGDFCDSGETLALIADAEALIGGDA